jgi:hypothetical protein
MAAHSEAPACRITAVALTSARVAAERALPLTARRTEYVARSVAGAEAGAAGETERDDNTAGPVAVAVAAFRVAELEEDAATADALPLTLAAVEVDGVCDAAAADADAGNPCVGDVTAALLEALATARL